MGGAKNEKEGLHEAMLCSQVKNIPQKGAVRCNLCSHYCLIPQGKEGLCLVRRNIGGKLYSLNYGKPVSLAMDPIEKKPFFHFRPGSKVLSFGTVGCNFRCLNCQNWELSQAVREKLSRPEYGEVILPGRIAELALREQADGIAYTYNEPTIFLEYARDIIKECRRAEKRDKNDNKAKADGIDPGDASFGGAVRPLSQMFVSNGYFSKEAFALIHKEKLLDAIRIDLKFMEDEKYHRICGSRLKPVLDSIKRVHESGIHLEVINLMIPGENCGEDDVRRLCEHLSRISPDIPLHFSRFFPHYKMRGAPPTELRMLQAAKRIAEDMGMRYVYIGNTDIPGAEDTHCPKCGELLIKRDRFGIEKNVLERKAGREKEKPGKDRRAGKHAYPACPKCGERINIVL